MRLRRYEFGIRTGGADVVEAYARQANGRLYLKQFPAASPDLLGEAEADFFRDSSTWRMVEGHPDARGLSLVWTQGARLYVSGEAALTTDALTQAAPHLVVSLNKLKPQTRTAMAAYLAEAPSAVHLDVPMLDVLPKHQREEGTRNATTALGEAAAALRRGDTVVIHCLMGIHRSVNVAAVALVRAGLAGDSARCVP